MTHALFNSLGWRPMVSSDFVFAALGAAAGVGALAATRRASAARAVARMLPPRGHPPPPGTPAFAPVAPQQQKSAMPYLLAGGAGGYGGTMVNSAIGPF